MYLGTLNLLTVPRYTTVSEGNVFGFPRLTSLGEGGSHGTKLLVPRPKCLLGHVVAGNLSTGGSALEFISFKN